MVEAIPSWKYFIFGGESTDFHEGATRSFGTVVNSACYLDIETLKWSTIHPENQTPADFPDPREYSAMSYDERNSRLMVFGGWNNGWLKSMYSLNVSKIVGPSYAITEIIPSLGQLSGKVPVTIKGCGFNDGNIQVIFTVGKIAVDSISNKNSCQTNATFENETTITAETPSFEAFGPKECTVQLQINGGDLTTTYVSFSYFMNTRAFKSLCYGPGLLDDQAINHPTEFIIQARNDLGENRTSGRDQFQVKITSSSATQVTEAGLQLDDQRYIALRNINLGAFLETLEKQV